MRLLVLSISLFIFATGLAQSDSLYSNENTFSKDFVKYHIPKGIKLFGVGESTHGSAENNHIRNDLFKELVMRKGCRFLFLEMDYSNTLILNKYVVHNQITVDSAMSAITYWLYYSEEFSELLMWMKDYNSAKKYSEKIRIIGYDFQYPPLIAKGIKKYLQKCGAEAQTLDSLLNPFMEIEYYDDSLSLPLEAYYSRISALEVIEKKACRVHFEEQEVEGFLESHSLTLLKLSITLQATVHQNGFVLRDSLTAVNCIKLAAKLSPDSPVFLAAHNEHISSQEYPYKNGLEFKSLGRHLKHHFDTSYQNVGIDFETGEILARKFKYLGFGVLGNKETKPKVVKVKKPGKKSFLAQVEKAKYVRHFSTDELASAHHQFKNNFLIHSIGAVYFKPITFIPLKPDSFDDLLIFEKSTATKPYRRSIK